MGFDFWGVVLGLAGHMMNSVILSYVFVSLFARGVRSRGGLVVGGAVYGITVFLIMWYLVLPAIDPVMLNLNLAVFVIAHLVWGGVLGWLLPVPSASSASVPAA